MAAPRPLEEGENQIGLTLGGPAVQVGAQTLPLPMTNLEYRRGARTLWDRPVDGSGGLNLTGLAFGVLQGHVGSTYLLVDEVGYFPALSMTNRLYFGTNVLASSSRAPGSTGFWGTHQVELVASRYLGQHLVYLGLGQYTDFGSPRLLLTPSFGFLFDPGAQRGWKFSVEGRYFAVNQRSELITIRWATEERGALGFGLGVSYGF